MSVPNANPQLSIVVNILLGGPHLHRALAVLATQRDAPPLEVIVPFSPVADDAADIAAAQRDYPAVRFVQVDGLPPQADLSHPGLAHLIYDRRRAVGLAAARGAIVALTEDQMVPDAGWCAAIAAAHHEPYAAVGGAIENRGAGLLHRALYLSDFGRYQLPFAAGEAAWLTDQNVSYKRATLEKIGPVWREFYHEPAVHDALRAAGETLWLTPNCVVWMDRGGLTLPSQIRERFAWGRVFGGQRALRVSPARRMVLAALSPLIPALIVWRRVSQAFRRHHPVAPLCAALPALAAMAVAWACGEAMGYFTAKPFPAGAGSQLVQPGTRVTQDPA